MWHCGNHENQFSPNFFENIYNYTAVPLYDYQLRFTNAFSIYSTRIALLILNHVRT